MEVCRWLWGYVQDDLILLQQEYIKLGYNLTLEQCYDVWQTYSENCSANWMGVSNVERSLNTAKRLNVIK